MRRLLCRLGWHRYAWAAFGQTVELWACGCGRVVIQFADEPLAMSEVDMMNQWLKRSEKNHVGS